MKKTEMLSYLYHYAGYVTLVGLGLLILPPIQDAETASTVSLLTTIKVAWMANWPRIYLFNASSSLGGLIYAVEKIKNDPTLLNGYDFQIKYKASNCNGKDAIGSMFDFLLENYEPDLYIGPVCSGAMAPVAQLASHMNRPVFGWISSDPPLNDKIIYTTLVRFLWPISYVGEGAVLLMNELGWKRVYIISSTGGDYGVLGSTVRDLIQSRSDDGFYVTRWDQDIDLQPNAETMREIYGRVKKEARIVILVTPDDELRDWMVAAYDMDMHEGGYVFIYLNQLTPDESFFNKMTSVNLWKKGEPDDEHARRAFESMFMIFARTLDFATTKKNLDKFYSTTNSTTWPNDLGVPLVYPDLYSMFLYDAMTTYAKLADGSTYNDGEALFAKARSYFSNDGATGNILLSDTADRIPAYWIFDMDKNSQFGISAQTINTLNGTKNFKILEEFRWGDGTVGKENAPTDIPSCGFNNEKCALLQIQIAVPVVVILVTIITIVVFCVVRKLRYESQLNNMAWKADYNDVHLYTNGAGAGSRMTLRTKSMSLHKSRASLTESINQQVFITTANYKGTRVAVKKVNLQKVKIDRKLLKEMKSMSEITHTNINTFMGACTDAPNICCLWEYFSMGSLSDVIFNTNIPLDDIFKFGIALDILKGLVFLHDSDLTVHGRLKSNNVVIDSRWVCKLTDYGLRQFLAGEEMSEEITDHAKYTKLFWTAPEILRRCFSEYMEQNKPLFWDTQSGDMYAAAVIIKEAFCSDEPYAEYEIDPDVIINKVMTPEGDDYFRPSLSGLSSVSEKGVIPPLTAFITTLWAEDPDQRPTARNAVKKLNKISPFKNKNVVENMIEMMTKYSQKLEVIVEERTVELRGERKKTEELLYRMLPGCIVADLRLGKTIMPELFDQVTIYFSDVVGFSDAAADSTPHQVVDLLNGLYRILDKTIQEHSVYKVETISDVYMMASGLPERNGDRHIVEIANCALDILSDSMGFKVPHNPSYKIGIRIGIHTGSCVAGVVGLAMPRYCLFGDTINTASRMESNGKLHRIHLSPFAYAALSKFSGYHLLDRGKIQVKGKGLMNTYWLIGRDDYSKSLPDFSQIMKDDPPPKELPPTLGKPIYPRTGRPSRESGYSDTGLSEGGSSRKASYNDVIIQPGKPDLPRVDIDTV